jgi:hypothetical protein
LAGYRKSGKEMSAGYGAGLFAKQKSAGLFAKQKSALIYFAKYVRPAGQFHGKSFP